MKVVNVASIVLEEGDTVYQLIRRLENLDPDGTVSVADHGPVLLVTETEFNG